MAGLVLHRPKLKSVFDVVGKQLKHGAISGGSLLMIGQRLIIIARDLHLLDARKISREVEGLLGFLFTFLFVP
jgi:hypothetical protein